MKKASKLYRFLIYIMPGILFFSYWPWINFGANSTMNFDLSLPLIWLVIFDVVAFYILVKKKLLSGIWKKWRWLLFPVFATLSVLWSHDKLRSILIIGVLWLIYFAVFSFYELKGEMTNKKFQKCFFKIFFGITLFVCGWCLVQCIMDIFGLSSSYTLLCDNCAYHVFGFPHPNGFAAEPQFMGNLLLAPILLSLYFLVKGMFFSKKSLLAIFLIFTSTLFLTLSRGAIYSFIVSMLFFTIVWSVKKTWKVMFIWIAVLFSFFFTLNLQGIFSELSRTNDTYIAGINKVVNQLTLGVVDFGGGEIKKVDGDAGRMDAFYDDSLPMVDYEDEESVFDGYVEVSTTSRLEMWQGALTTWAKDFINLMFGVGLGSGLMSAYEDGTIYSSREIINNQYVSLLLETGIVGVLLLVFSLVLVFKAIYKKQNSLLIFTLIIAYMVSLLFFSGLPNALHIYLLPALLIIMLL